MNNKHTYHDISQIFQNECTCLSKINQLTTADVDHKYNDDDADDVAATAAADKETYSVYLHRYCLNTFAWHGSQYKFNEVRNEPNDRQTNQIGNTKVGNIGSGQ